MMVGGLFDVQSDFGIKPGVTSHLFISALAVEANGSLGAALPWATGLSFEVRACVCMCID